MPSFGEVVAEVAVFPLASDVAFCEVPEGFCEDIGKAQPLTDKSEAKRNRGKCFFIA